jgi:hypothetical protein
MKIQGKLTGKTYNVYWRSSGWSHAVPFVKVRLTFFGIKLWYNSVELPHKTRGFLGVKEGSLHDRRRWFQDAIDRYETHALQWGYLDDLKLNEYEGN